ncbi:MAG: formate dehydrogenase [Alphaproteobacteria bacterium]|nr:formate dehydrogenase [Alphaproteobacteria bacterium]
MREKDGKRHSRRNFMRSLGRATAAAAVAAAIVPVDATRALATESAQDKRKARYRETDHVKAFYRTNRY